MKIFKRLIVIALTVVFFGGCQKEITFNGEPAHGSLKSALTGDCNPITINGFYQEDSTLNADNWVEVQVNSNFAGNFDIKSDTVNGFSFHRAGYIPLGLNTIRLFANGKPDTAISTTFTVFFDTTFCTFTVNVLASTAGAAHYILGGSPGACASFTPHGTYTVGTPLDASDSVTFLVNVTTPGIYSITTATVNGMKFTGAGTFPNLGITQVTLHGSGTPTSVAAASFSPTGDGTTCTFSITPGSAVPPAVYVLGGNGANCTGVTPAGVYMASIPTSASNTVTVDVNVTTPGTYSMSTTTANNVKFSKSGTFTVTGPQQVTLVADGGTPTASGPTTYLITGASTTCSFSINYAPAPPPAVFTLSGDPGACSPATINGTYTVGIALNTTNTIDLQVNVTTAGVYSISTNTVGGMKFTAVGVFTSTGGPFTVTLKPTAGSNPTTAGVNTLTPSGNSGATMCTFDINVGAAPTGIYNCKIDGVFTSFYDRAEAKIDDLGSPYLYLNGYTGPPNGNSVPQLQIFITKNDNSQVGPGSYNENSLLVPNGYRIEIDYHQVNPDMSVTIFNTSSNLFPPPNPPFTIVVLTRTATRVTGTFSGQLHDTLLGGMNFKTITEGHFDLPIQ